MFHLYLCFTTAAAYIKILKRRCKINIILLRFCKFSRSISLAWGRENESETNSMNLQCKLIRGSLFVINYTGTKLDLFFSFVNTIFVFNLEYIICRPINNLIKILTNSKEWLILFNVFCCKRWAHADSKWRQRKSWKKSSQQKFEVHFLQKRTS